MPTSHVTARGIVMDMDRLRLANETTIAVGNMKVNARGDQLGPGGKVIKTRSEVMAEKNKLHNAPLADEFEVAESLKDEDMLTLAEPVAPTVLQPTAEETPVVETTAAPTTHYVKPRGSFAESVAQNTEVVQELMDPKKILRNTAPGVKRI